MRSMSKRWFVLGLVLWAPLTQESAVAQEDPPPVILEGVTVIPMNEDTELADRSVLIRGRRIREIGPTGSVTAPDGAIRVDARGKFLIPGLSEMHAHIPSPQSGAEAIDDALFLFLANGITTIRGMLGHAHHLDLRASVARGERLGPQIFTSSPSLNGNSVPDRATAWRLVTEHRAAGYDLLKIHPGVARPVYDEIAAVARAEGIPFAGHVPAEVGLLHALESGQQTIEHIDGYMQAILADDAPVAEGTVFFGYNLVPYVEESKIEMVVEATRAAGAWVTPTQILMENIFLGDLAETAARPEMRFLPDTLVEGWVSGIGNARREWGYDAEQGRRFVELRRLLIRELHGAGVGLLLGADAPQIFNVPGFATLRELVTLVEAGLSPYEALVTGTRNPAEYLGVPGSFGTIEVGKRADLVLLDANPLEDIANVQRVAGVMAAGRWLPRDTIDARLEELAARH